MIKSLINEYGLSWVFNRSLYSAKLKLMRTIPTSENLFEKKIDIKRVDIFDLNIKLLEEFLYNLPHESKEKIISIADNAIEGKILGFSSVQLDYGNPIRWNYNPITGKAVDKKLKWYQISDFDYERGDIKAIWEISRFTHFFYFVRAYMLTKNKKYYQAFSDQLQNWLDENKYSFGPNYKCGQESTLRMINAIIGYSAFKLHGLTDSKDENNLCQLVGDSYKKVLSNFFYAHKCIKNNHTLSEITGLIIGAWASKNEKALNKAYTLLDKEIEKQFLPDGGYLQYSFNYQRFALQIAEFVIKISEKTGCQISDQSKRLIRNSAYVLYQLQDETGDVPNYGSNDGALIFPVTPCGYRDYRPIINTIFTLVEDHKIFSPGPYDEELIWFGVKDPKDYPVSAIMKQSEMFEESGLYSLRHTEGFLMTILQSFNTRPAQMDQLHIDLWHKGVNVFCDSGSYSYASDLGKAMSLTSAHNTNKVQGKEQMNKRGPFFIFDWAKRSNINYTKDSFEGSMISQRGYKHTRNIKKTDSGYMVKDIVIGKVKSCESYLHTPCIVKKVDTGFELFNGDQKICSVFTKNPIEVKKSYRSLYYLVKEEINCVILKGNIEENQWNIEFEIKLN